MEMETVFDFIPEQTETSPEPETSLSPDPLESSDPIEESSPFVESEDPEESEPASGSDGSVSVSKEESTSAETKEESIESVSSETVADKMESETSISSSASQDKETSSYDPAANIGSDVPDLLDQIDSFIFLESDPESVLDWQENLAACRGSLASCASLLVFTDILLCLLLGCLCASIFSRFWKVNRWFFRRWIDGAYWYF